MTQVANKDIWSLEEVTEGGSDLAGSRDSSKMLGAVRPCRRRGKDSGVPSSGPRRAYLKVFPDNLILPAPTRDLEFSSQSTGSSLEQSKLTSLPFFGLSSLLRKICKRLARAKEPQENLFSSQEPGWGRGDAVPSHTFPPSPKRQSHK